MNNSLKTKALRSRGSDAGENCCGVQKYCWFFIF
jgi:hypothetical protein